MKKTKRFFSLLEVMVAISLLAMGAGALFYRMKNLIAQKQFETDANRLKNVLLSTRLLALNTHADWKLNFKTSAKGWTIQLICREDPELVYPMIALRQKELLLNQQKVNSFTLNFFSTGQVKPTGEICLKKTSAKTSYEVKLNLPEFFKMEENGKMAPLHPTSSQKSSAK